MIALFGVIALVLVLRRIGVSEPLAAFIAALSVLLFVGLPIDKAALLFASTAPRMLDYISLIILVAAISAALLGGMTEDRERPYRPFGWSALGDLRFFVIYLALCALIADQFQKSVIQVFATYFLYAAALFALALVATVLAGGRQAFSIKKILASIAILVFIIFPTAAPVLFGFFTPTEAACIVVLPLALLTRVTFDLANQRKFAGILDDMIRGAVDGAWILLAVLGATVLVYGLRLQGPLASVAWFAMLSPALFLAAYATLTLLLSAALGTFLGFLVAWAFFFPPFVEAGLGLQSETTALVAMLCLLTSLARPELGLKVLGARTSANISKSQLAGFAAAAIMTLAVALIMAPARF